MIEADVVLAWFCSGTVAKDAFERPTRFIQLPTPEGRAYDKQIASFGNTPLRNLLKMYAPDVRPLRVAAIGFSEGCQGVRALLRSADGRRVDSAITIDGVHAQYRPQSHRELEPAWLNAYAAFGQMAAQGARLFVDTTSSIVPEYPTVSTTATANWLWRAITGSDEPEQQNPLPDGVIQHFDPPLVYKAGKSGTLEWPETTYPVAPLYQYRNRGAAWFLNYSDLDRTGHNDHVLQAEHVLPMVLRRFLAARWNQVAPEQGLCVLSGPDEPTDPALPIGCFPPTRLSDLYIAGQAEPAYLDIDPFADPFIPTPERVMQPPAEDDRGGGGDTYGTVVKWVGGLFASAAVIALARELGGYIAREAAHDAEVERRARRT